MMFVLGLILMLGGIGAAGYGIYLNNDVEAQLTSLFSSGSMDPGNTWLIAGGVAAVVGLLLLIFGRKK